VITGEQILISEFASIIFKRRRSDLRDSYSEQGNLLMLVAST